MARRHRGSGVLLRAHKVHYTQGVHPHFHRVQHAVLTFYGPRLNLLDFGSFAKLKLRVLDLSCNNGSLFFDNLSKALPLFNRLTRLKLRQTNFFGTNPESVIAALAQTNVRELDLTGNPMGNTEISLHGLELESLRLGNTMIGASTPLDGLLIPGLKSLDLSQNDLGSENGEPKLEALRLYLEKKSTTLCSLNLSYNMLSAQGDEVMERFVTTLGRLEASPEGGLKQLDLSYNDLGSKNGEPKLEALCPYLKKKEHDSFLFEYELQHA